MAFRYRGSSLRPIEEKEQRAAIVHRDGIEKLVIAINIEPDDHDKALWIFPVPGTPSEVKLDVLDAFPRFSGFDPRRAAAERVGLIMMLARATQVYPLIIDFIVFIGASPEFRVHQEIEKCGVHAELITVDSADGLASYLQDREAPALGENLVTFEPYLSDDYVLVVAWIASREELLDEFPEYEARAATDDGRWPCLYVEFPTDRPFYPLRPTSAYGDEWVPVQLFVVDHVQAETDPSLAKKLRIFYYEQLEVGEEEPEQFMAGLSPENVRYTTVEIRAPAKELVDDLWFSPVQPEGMDRAHLVLKVLNVWTIIPLAIVVVAAISYVSGGLTGLFLFGRWRVYARLGLWNLLSIWGLSAAISRKSGPIGDALRIKKTNFLCFFSIVFTVITVMIQVVAYGVLLEHQH